MPSDYIRWVPGERTMKRIGRVHAALYRLSGGRVGGRMDGLDMLLLTTRGRHSNEPRTTPLPYFRNGDDLLLVASFGGSPRNPAWLLNLEAKPDVTARIRTQRWAGQAEVTSGSERDALWQQITAEHPRYVAYQKKTGRQIPVVVLRGAAAGA